MTKHWALVVEWWTPDDTDHHTTLAAMANLIRANSPRTANNITVYTDVSADLIAEAARASTKTAE